MLSKGGPTARQVWLVTWSPPPVGDLFFSPLFLLFFSLSLVFVSFCAFLGVSLRQFLPLRVQGSCLSRFFLPELALVFVMSSPFCGFQLGLLGFFSGFLDALFYWCYPRVDSFDTCSRRRLQVYDSSSWNAALFAFHDQPDLPHFPLYSRSP